MTPQAIYAIAQHDDGILILKSANGRLAWSIVMNGISPNTPDATIEMTDIETDPSNTDVAYVSTSRGLFKTVDGARFWERIDNDDMPRAQTIAIQPHTSSVYVGTARGVATSGKSGSWRDSNGGLISTAAFIQIDPVSSNVLYAITAGFGLYSGASDTDILKSVNGGRSWTLIHEGLPSPFTFNDLLIDRQQSNVLYLPLEQGFYISQDGGLHWSKRSDQVIHTITQSPSKLTRLYGLLETDVVRSDDSGVNWDTVGAVPDVGLYETFTSLAADPHDPGTLYLGSTVLFGNAKLRKSVDGGATWANTGLLEPVFDLIIDPINSSVLYAHVVGAIKKSLDAGTTWARADNDLPSDENGVSVQSLTSNPQSPDTLYASIAREDVNEIYRTLDGGAHWLPIGAKASVGLTTLTVQPTMGILLASTQDSGLLKIVPDYPLVWWDTAKKGQGVTLLPRGERLWGAWYFYDSQGDPSWLIFDEAPAKNRLTAALYRYRGPALGSAWDVNALAGRQVGTAVLDLADARQPKLDYNVEGVSGTLDLSVFMPGAGGAGDGFSGEWWDVAKPGQGITLLQQGDFIWGTWNLYDAEGADTWLLFAGTRAGDSLSTALLQYRGSALGAPWDENLLQAQTRGTVAVDFRDPEAIEFDYSLDGASGVLNLSRF
ncbi:MAG: sialidase family protein [Gammaproteobacteria bacterium]